MGAKGYTRIYLLAAVFAAAGISGCAPIKETTPLLNMYVQLRVQTFPDSDPAVRLIAISKAGDNSQAYKPSAKATLLWLRPGEYTATLKCNRLPVDRNGLEAIKNGHLLSVNLAYTFKVESEKVSYYRLDCGVDDSMRQFISYSEVLEFTER